MTKPQTEVTVAKQLEPYQFKPGQSGNPKGRPKGARSKLGEAFLADVLDAWEERGPEAIAAMIEDKPGDFVKVVASILPKQAELTVKDHSELSEEELRDRIQHLAERLGPFLTERTGSTDNGIAGKAIEAKPARVHKAH